MRQTDLFAELDFQQPVSERPDPEVIRHRLLAMLTEAKKADRMPWPPQEARVNEVVFPQMANWLPQDEAEQLRFEFAQEIQRLKSAA